MTTSDIFNHILDLFEEQGFELTQNQVDIIQRHSSNLAEELEAAE